MVFNGDFHWFDTEPGLFETIQRRVLAHTATSGNVEAELARPSGAGCGCGYPDSVDDDTVARSNAIMARLQGAATRGHQRALSQLPYFRAYRVGGVRAVVLHGDPDSLAGWGLAADSSAMGDPEARVLADWFRRADADVFVCSHTCLPCIREIVVDGRPRCVINNGSAGMPNFADTRYGLAVRIATRPANDAVFGTVVNGMHVAAVALPYDHDTWIQRFREVWARESPARQSYEQRILHGPRFDLGDVYTADPG
ncbi:metallophosphoesterase family protein [Arhodomonas aquaeolei]|uniref:metallophosphoesterase family protein n=1 Tax=Arhodomonas aquaeolei TaxID=2369 RepID=UPI0003A0BC7E|nr:hypothetical protein [Arhodomonas aquaeolei]